MDAGRPPSPPPPDPGRSPELADTQTDPGAATRTARAPMRPHYGRYELVGELGAGGMGTVYEAYDPELDRRVALKVMRPSARTLLAGGRELLLREARALARLTHPNVIAIHDVGGVGDEAFVAMELVQGRTLRDWLRDRPRGLDEVLDVFAQAGRGLAAAHAVGLVHRDFKPSNVMIGADGRVRVLDFGLARRVEAGEPAADRAGGDGGPSSSELSRTGAVVGTPAYMAPEQCVGDAVDARTDQFSFCVALYEAIFGVAPFAGDTVEQRAARILAGELVAPVDARSVPARLRAAVVRGLQASPDDRHPSMDALLQELAGVSRARRRRRARVAAAVALGLAGVTAGVVALAARDADDAPPAEVAPHADAAALRMQMVDGASARMTALSAHVDADPEAHRLGIRSDAETWHVDGVGETTSRYVVGADRPALERYLESVFRSRPDLAPEPGHELLLEPRDGEWRTHYLWTRVELDATFIADARIDRDDAGDPEVLVTFDERGKALLAAVTGQNQGRRIATIVDGVVTSSALIQGPILGGQVALTMGGPDPATRAREAEAILRALTRGR